MPHDGRSSYAALAFAFSKRNGIDIHDLSSLDEYEDADWIHFNSIYQHASPNPRAFELACIRRYFYARAFAVRAGFETFAIMDTDVLLYPSAHCTLSTFASSDYHVALSPSSSFDAPHYSPHFGLWRLDTIDDFISFILDLYTDPRRIHEHIERNFSPYRGCHTVSDMTLLYEWVSQRRPRILDTSRFDLKHPVDHNITSTIHAQSPLSGCLGARGIKLGNEYATCSTHDGNQVRFCALHFQGKAKRLMKFAVSGNSSAVFFGLMALSFARDVRKLKRRHTRSLIQG